MKNSSATRFCTVDSGFDIESDTINYHDDPQIDVVIVDIRLIAEEAKRKKPAAKPVYEGF